MVFLTTKHVPQKLNSKRTFEFAIGTTKFLNTAVQARIFSV